MKKNVARFLNAPRNFFRSEGNGNQRLCSLLPDGCSCGASATRVLQPAEDFACTSHQQKQHDEQEEHSRETADTQFDCFTSTKVQILLFFADAFVWARRASGHAIDKAVTLLIRLLSTINKILIDNLSKRSFWFSSNC